MGDIAVGRGRRSVSLNGALHTQLSELCRLNDMTVAGAITWMVRNFLGVQHPETLPSQRRRVMKKCDECGVVGHTRQNKKFHPAAIKRTVRVDIEPIKSLIAGVDIDAHLKAMEEESRAKRRFRRVARTPIHDPDREIKRACRREKCMEHLHEEHDE